MRRGFILPLFIWGSVVFFPFLLFAGLRTVPQRVGIAPGKPDLRVERIQIVKNAWASKLVTDLPFEVWVDIKNVGAGAVPGEQAEVKLKIYTTLDAPPLYESTLRIRISNRTRRARAHFRGIAIRGSEVSITNFLTIGIRAEVDPSNSIEEANERNNRMTVLPNLYRAVRDLTLRRAYVEGLEGRLVTLPPERVLRVRFVIENTGNVMVTGKTVLRAALLKGVRGNEAACTASSSPLLRLNPGERTEALLVMRDVEPNIVQSEGVPQLALYRLNAMIFPETRASVSRGRRRAEAVVFDFEHIPPNHTFTSAPFYVEGSEGHLYIKDVVIREFKVRGSQVYIEGTVVVTGTGEGAWRRYRDLKIYFNIYRRGVPEGMQLVTLPLSRWVPESRKEIKVRETLSDFLKNLFYDPKVTQVGIRAVLDEENYGEVLLSFRKNRWHVRSGPLSLSEDRCVQLSIPFERSYDGDDISFQVRVDPACVRGKSSPGVMAYYSPEGAPYGARDAWDSCSGCFNEDVISGRPCNFTARLGRCEWDRVKIGALFYWGPRGERKFSKHARVILDHERVFERTGFRRMVRGRERTILVGHPAGR